MHIHDGQNSKIGSLFKHEELLLLMPIKSPKMRQIDYMHMLEYETEPFCIPSNWLIEPSAKCYNIKILVRYLSNREQGSSQVSFLSLSIIFSKVFNLLNPDSFASKVNVLFIFRISSRPRT